MTTVRLVNYEKQVRKLSSIHDLPDKLLELVALARIGAAAVDVRRSFHDESISQSEYAKQKFAFCDLCDEYLASRKGE